MRPASGYGLGMLRGAQLIHGRGELRLGGTMNGKCWPMKLVHPDHYAHLRADGCAGKTVYAATVRRAAS
jgi:hypothetical protein